MATDRRGTCGASAAEGFTTRCMFESQRSFVQRMRRLADVHDERRGRRRVVDPLLAARPDLQAARHVLTAQDGEAAVIRVGAGAEPGPGRITGDFDHGLQGREHRAAIDLAHLSRASIDDHPEGVNAP